MSTYYIVDCDVRFYYAWFMLASTLGQGVGGNCPQTSAYSQMWHETLFDELKASVYRCKKERSVASKIRQNAFPAVFPLVGAHNAPQTP